MELSRLDGRAALVMGAGQAPGGAVGMGRAAAITFARAGARVGVADRDPAAADATVQAILDEGGEAVPVVVDITDEASIVAAVAEAQERLGGIHVLHNNVGISVGAGDTTITEITPEVFDRVTAINLRGMILTCKHVIPVMQRQGGGSIVSVGSTAPRTNYAQITYKTSKAGVEAMSQNIAWLHAPDGIRSNVVIPGLIDTPMAIDTRVALTGRPREELIAERSTRIPLGGRIGTAWDVANAALFFASEQSSFITGQAIVVDGGWTLQVG